MSLVPASETVRVTATCGRGHALHFLGGADQFGRLVFLSPGPCEGCKSMPPPKDGKLSWREKRAAKRLFKDLG